MVEPLLERDDVVLLASEERSCILTKVRDSLAGTVNYVLHSAEYARTDRLWPSETHLFVTNPLSVAYGACGPALLLQAMSPQQCVPEKVVECIHRQPLSVEEYPPGLYLELAGALS